MRKISMKVKIVCFVVLLMLKAAIYAENPINSNKPLINKSNKNALYLWYKKPAEQWVEALPVGNGSLGAMVFGGISKERLQLNEDTMWAGGPYQPANPKGRDALAQIRKSIFDGNYSYAANLAQNTMMGQPIGLMQYQTIGDLYLTFDNDSNVHKYRRELDISKAVASVSFSIDGVDYKREVLSSYIDQVIAVQLTASKMGMISFGLGLNTPQKAKLWTEGTDTLVMEGVNSDSNGIKGALKFQTRIKIMNNGGEIESNKDSISVSQADSVTILIAAATSYKSYNDVSADPAQMTKKCIGRAIKKPYKSIRKDHIKDYQELFNRVGIDLGATDAVNMPTDQRIKGSSYTNDPQLAALYFQFGRYLLISSSRPGSQPANLQGIWNDSMTPPWGSKYTININAEMNYWPAEITNLSECSEPLFDIIKDLSQTGSHTARVTYGARGWVTHHNTDLWRASAPVDGPFWGMWPTGGAWLCKHIWDHYEFTFDKEFLAEYYPVIKGSAQFFLDTLVEEPVNGWLVTCPSVSPENSHPFGTSVCAGPTMDSQIIRDLFSNCISAANVLGIDTEFIEELEAVKERLAPNQIGANGQLQEWLEDWDMQAPDLHHRHVSHLYGLYPSEQINIFDTPDLANAAQKSLEIRGDDATGWGIGWRLNLWARLHDSDHAYKILGMLLRPSRTYPNMFDAHPPFQIDGNFGGTAGVSEMLLQSRCLAENKWEIEPLPALPKAWPNGSVSGLCTKGGFEVDIDWKNGNITKLTIHSRHGNQCQIRYLDIVSDLSIKKGGHHMWTP